MVLMIVEFQLFRKPQSLLGPHSPFSFAQSRRALLKGARRLHTNWPFTTQRHAIREHWWNCSAQASFFSHSSLSSIDAVLGSIGLEYDSPGVLGMAATCPWDISPMLAWMVPLMNATTFSLNFSLFSAVFISVALGASLSQSSI